MVNNCQQLRSTMEVRTKSYSAIPHSFSPYKNKGGQSWVRPTSNTKQDRAFWICRKRTFSVLVVEIKNIFSIGGGGKKHYQFYWWRKKYYQYWRWRRRHIFIIGGEEDECFGICGGEIVHFQYWRQRGHIWCWLGCLASADTSYLQLIDQNYISSVRKCKCDRAGIW